MNSKVEIPEAKYMKTLAHESIKDRLLQVASESILQAAQQGETSVEIELPAHCEFDARRILRLVGPELKEKGYQLCLGNDTNGKYAIGINWSNG